MIFQQAADRAAEMLQRAGQHRIRNFFRADFE
jgi:hypothetical protein